MQLNTQTGSQTHLDTNAGTRAGLDALSKMSDDQLERLYREGSVPDDLTVLNGKPEGRLLAVRNAGEGLLAAGLRRLASWRAFPWAGKVFQATSTQRGGGRNRIRLGRESELVPFETYFDQSALDGERCIVLDYDVAANPAPARRIRDELRQVGEGLYLGPMFLKSSGGQRMMLWWAVGW